MARKATNVEARKSYGMEEQIGSLFQPDTLLAEEYFGNFRRKIPLEPEKALMLSVLEDGVNCFQENLFAESGKKRALRDEAREWLFSDDSDHVFSFSSICAALDLNPGYIRRGLRRWAEQNRKAAKKKNPSMAPERLVA